MDDEWLTQKEVASILKMESSTFTKYRKRQKDFPPPIDIGTTEKGKPTLRWKKSEVTAFLVLRAALQRRVPEEEEDA